jgi:polyvinyl alcohol dehydrogenase (cytochrome)
LILIGQKSGIGWALDPSKRGDIVWQHRVGKGSALGGMEFGSGTDGHLVYFPNADARYGPQEAGGIAALAISSGEQVWFTRPPGLSCVTANDPKCVQAQAAAITVIPGVIFSGSTNGIMRAYGADDGRIIWEYDSAHRFETVNAVTAAGGGINGPGPIVVGGMLFMTSGYAALGNGLPGNVLLAFSLER